MYGGVQALADGPNLHEKEISKSKQYPDVVFVY